MNVHSCKSIEVDDGDLSTDWPVLYTCCISPFSISKSQSTVEACLMEEVNYDECHSSAWHYIYWVQMVVIIPMLYGYVLNQFNRVDEISIVVNTCSKFTYRYYQWIVLKWQYGNLKIEELWKMRFQEITVSINTLIDGHVIASKSG